MYNYMLYLNDYKIWFSFLRMSNEGFILMIQYMMNPNYFWDKKYLNIGFFEKGLHVRSILEFKR